MGKFYSIDGSQSVASPTDSVLGLTGDTTVRAEIYDGWIGTLETPGADNALQFIFQRYTAAGTGTAVTPHSTRGDPAAASTAKEDHTIEPTYTADEILLNLPLNQRATHRIPLQEKGKFQIPAVAGNGIGIQPVHSSFTGNVTTTIHFEE